MKMIEVEITVRKKTISEVVVTKLVTEEEYNDLFHDDCSDLIFDDEEIMEKLNRTDDIYSVYEYKAENYEEHDDTGWIEENWYR